MMNLCSLLLLHFLSYAVESFLINPAIHLTGSKRHCQQKLLMLSDRVTSWTTEDVCKWLSSKELNLNSDIINKFKLNEITGLLLADFNSTDLEVLFGMDAISARRVCVYLKPLKKTRIVFCDAYSLECTNISLYGPEGLKDLLQNKHASLLRQFEDPSCEGIVEFDELIDGAKYILDPKPERDVDKELDEVSRHGRFNRNLSTIFEEKINEAAVNLLSKAYKTTFEIVWQGKDIISQTTKDTVGEIDGCLASSDLVVLIETKINLKDSDFDQLVKLMKKMQSDDNLPNLNMSELTQGKKVIGALATFLCTPELVELAAKHGFLLFTPQNSNLREWTGALDRVHD